MFPRLFNEGPYRFEMRFAKAALESFYAPTPNGGKLLQERRGWLERDPGKHLVLLPEAEPLLREFFALACIAPQLAGAAAPDARAACLEAGSRLEPDWLLLQRGPGGARLVCGCVCFPSSWDVREKLGLPIGEIHDVVPGLNPSIGAQIEAFLDRLRLGVSWERANWGLSRSPELNQHPSRNLPKLDETAGPGEIFLRVEHQSLAALPESGGILFGIRIQAAPLEEVRREEPLREGLLRALETMPEPMAGYKNIARARARIIGLLRE